MKILLVITKAVVGGAQTSVLNLAREMKARGHEVAVGAGDGEWLPAELAKENIPFIRFKNLRRTHNPFSPLFFILELKNFLNKSPLKRGVSRQSGTGCVVPEFGIVHFNSSNALPGALGAKLADKKIKTVFTFRGMSMLDEHYKINFFLKFLYSIFFRFFLLFVDAPVFVSRENFDKFGRGQLTKKGSLIYNGLDSERMSFVSRAEAAVELARKIESPLKRGVAEGRGMPGAVFADKNILQDKYLIGSIGRLDYAKNYEFLINIFPEILKIRPDACAVIIGEGPERGKYEDLIEKNNLKEKVFLLGNINNGSRYLKGFDLLALPSRYEGLAIALIEALFADLPILAADVGGNREVAGADEEIYQLDNQEEFLNKFKSLQELDTLNKVIENNRRQAEKFNLKNTVSGYEKIYREIK